MKTYNVKVSVVELIESDSPDDAIATLQQMLKRAGFEPLWGEDNAFESEELGA